MTLQLTKRVKANLVNEQTGPVFHLQPSNNKDAKLKVSNHVLPYCKTIANIVEDLGVKPECKEPIPLLHPACTEEVVRFLIGCLNGLVCDETLWHSTDDTELAVLSEVYFGKKQTGFLLQFIDACEYLEVPLLQRVAGFQIMRRIEKMASKYPRSAYKKTFGGLAQSYVWRYVFQHCEEVQLARCLGCVEEWDICLIERTKMEQWEPDVHALHRLLNLHGHLFDLQVSVPQGFN